VHRVDYSGLLMPLDPAAFESLCALRNAATVGEALANVDDAEAVFRWFREWSAAGIFAEVA
jgi:hypothetical protein